MKWTATEVHNRLKAYVYPANEYLYLTEVRSCRGFASKSLSYADAIAICLWPSRGHYLQGIEIKVSRSDWMSELKKPAKSAEIFKHCISWTLATPEGVVMPGELPPKWGHIIVKEDKAKHAKRPMHTEGVKELDTFVMSLLGNMAKQNEANIKMKIDLQMQEERVKHRQELEDHYKQGTELMRIKMQLDQHNDRMKNFNNIINAAGIRWNDVTDEWNSRQMIKDLKEMRAWREMFKEYDAALHTARRMIEEGTKIKEALETIKGGKTDGQ